MGPGSGTRISDDPSLTGAQHALLIYTTYVPCTMCLRYSGLLFGTWQRIGCLAVQERGQKSNNEEEGGQGGNCPGATRLRTLSTGQTARLRLQDRADEQGLDVRACCCVLCDSPVSKTDQPLQPHPHTHARPLWESQMLDVKNTTLGLLVPDYRQGSYPVPCRWKDEPG